MRAPRTLIIVVASAGVLLAGAAFVYTESHYVRPRSTKFTPEREDLSTPPLSRASVQSEMSKLQQEIEEHRKALAAMEAGASSSTQTVQQLAPVEPVPTISK